MKVAIWGTGYVGLVTGVCLASKGHQVTCVDIRDDVVKALQFGTLPIHERDLPELLQRVLASQKFHVTTRMEEAFQDAELVMIAVGTPSTQDGIDLSQVLEAARQIGSLIKKSTRHVTVIIKSTVIPGSTLGPIQKELETSSGKKIGDFGLGMNPEFLRQGEAVQDFLQPDRIVLGAMDEATADALDRLYAPWNCDKLTVNPSTAEMIKYANNSLLALQISAANELANLSARIPGVDAMDVLKGVYLDKRWNPILPDGTRAQPAILTYLFPGCGFGGSCFPKDLKALIAQGTSQGLPMELFRAVVSVNERQPYEVIHLLKQALGSLSGKRILVLGLAFKPGTDDMRESPALIILPKCIREGAFVTAHDPASMEKAGAHFKDLNIRMTRDWKGEIEKQDAIVVLTAWEEYRELIHHRDKLSGKPVVDARRLFHPKEFKDSIHLTIGKGSPNARSH